ncbi:MAG: hypothetical protein ACLGID_21740, partial [Gammaproteobacteria bacterium]
MEPNDSAMVLAQLLAASERFNRLLKYSPPTVRDSRPAATIKPPTDQTDEPSMRGADTFTESL